MKRNLRNPRFGFQTKQSEATAISRAQLRADIDANGTTLFKPRVRRIIGLTEQRLRARNQQWWMMTRKGWSDLFGRVMSII